MSIEASANSSPITVTATSSSVSAAVGSTVVSSLSSGGVGPQGPQGEPGQSGASAWGDITGKPSTFAPEAHAASHGASGADPVTIAASQLTGGSLPAGAALDFSDGARDSEVGGWGFGVEVTSDISQFAKVEPTGFLVAAGSANSVVVSGITNANDGYIAGIMGWGDPGGTKWSDLNGTYVRTSVAVRPAAYTDGNQGMHTPEAGTHNYYLSNPLSFGSPNSAWNGIAYFLAPGNRSGWGDADNDEQTDTPVNYWRLVVLCDWPFTYFTNPSSDATAFPTTGWVPVSASAPTGNEGAGYNGADYLGNYGGGFSVSGGGGSSHLSSESLTVSGTGGSTIVTAAGVTLPNATQVIVGSFDNSTGGANGISLICALGYELNWQGGRLRNVQVGGNGTPQPIYVESQLIVAPSASDSSIRVGSIELQSYSTNNCWIGDNVYLDGSRFLRRAAGAAGQFYFQGNEGQFRFSGSGAAGSVVSYEPVAKFAAGGIFAVGPSLGFSNGNLSGAILYCTGSSVGIADSTDLTKKLQFDVSLVAADTTRTLSAPDASGTIALTGHTHALGDLSQSGATTGQVVQWNGSAWVAGTVTAGSTAWADITGKPSFFSGSYADLTGKPTIFDGAYSSLTGRPTLGTAAAAASGDFAAASHTHALSSLTQSSASNGQTITWNGSAWVASTPTSYTLPVATGSVLGGVKQGSNVTIGSDGTISVAGPVTTLPYSSITGIPSLATVATSGSYADLSNKPTIPSAYTLPTASASTIGGIKVGSGLSIDGSSVLSATYSYSLPSATTSTLGGVIVGTGLAVSSGTVSVAYGTSSSTACVGNDSRLSDSRSPTAHNQAWSTITSTPTTLSGYGITDAAASSHAHALSSLTQSSATTGQVATWNGTAWAPATVSSGGSATTSASDLTSGTLADARLSATAQNAINLHPFLLMGA